MFSERKQKKSAPAVVYLGLGANIKNPAENLHSAFDLLQKEVLNDARLSSLYITEPMDVKDQPEFINAVCCGLFSGSPRQLLEDIHRIEALLGRNRSREQRRGPRPIDIDILLFGNLVISEPDLIIPHERLRNRKFALVPLLEISPEITDPGSGVLYSAALSEIDDQWIQRFD